MKAVIFSDTMTNDKPTEVNQAFDAFPSIPDVYYDFLLYMIRANTLRNIIYAGFNLLTFMPQWAPDGLEDSRREYVQTLAESAEGEVEADFGSFHALYLMGVWGAFESYVEDVCKGMLATKPNLLDTAPSKRS